MEPVFWLAFLALLVCIVGLIRPFRNFDRKHFGWGAAGAFVLMLVTVPPSPESSSANSDQAKPAVSPLEAAALEKRNAAEIAKLREEVVSVPSSDPDANLRIYSRLVELAPANREFADKKAEYEAKIAARARYRDNPEEALEIKDMDWSKGGFGSVMIIDRLTIRNDAPFNIKDFVLLCVHQGPSGTDMDRNTRTVYEIVPAGGEKTVREIHMGFIHSQVATSRCEIRDAVAI